ncbi:MAG: hypothetical protein ACRD3N_14150 [Terracidiphilus sp.]
MAIRLSLKPRFISAPRGISFRGFGWRKISGRPLIASPPAGFDFAGFRDPSAWRDGSHWYMTVGR